MRLRRAAAADVPALLALVNGYAERGLLLPRTEESVRASTDTCTGTCTEEGGRGR